MSAYFFNLIKQKKMENRVGFQDEKGKNKYLQKCKKSGDLRHTGNRNYIETNAGVEYYNAAKVAKSILHKIGF